MRKTDINKDDILAVSLLRGNPTVTDSLARVKVTDLNAVIYRTGFGDQKYDSGKRGIEVEFLDDDTYVGFGGRKPAGTRRVIPNCRSFYGTWAQYQADQRASNEANERQRRELEARRDKSRPRAAALNERQEKLGLVDPTGRPLFEARLNSDGSIYFFGRPRFDDVDALVKRIEELEIELHVARSA